MKDPIFIRYRIIVIGLLILAVAVGFAVLFYTQMQSEMKKTRSLEAEIDKVSTERVSISKKIKDIEGEKKALKQELEEYSRKAQMLQADIAEIRKTREGIQEELSKKERMILTLNNRLNSVIRQQTQLNAELEKAKSDYQQTVRQIETTRQEKQALEEEIKQQISAPGGVELKKIVVKVTPFLEGEVIEVNTEYKFVIIDLGIKDDIKSGDLLGIYRRGTLIAKAVVENVYEDMSSAIVLDEWADVRILEGDTVRL